MSKPSKRVERTIRGEVTHTSNENLWDTSTILCVKGNRRIETDERDFEGRRLNGNTRIETFGPRFRVPPVLVNETRTTHRSSRETPKVRLVINPVTSNWRLRVTAGRYTGSTPLPARTSQSLPTDQLTVWSHIVPDLSRPVLVSVYGNEI